MAVKYYIIPIEYSDGRQSKAVVGVFDGPRPDYTADGYGTGTEHSISDILAYFKEKTGVAMTDLTPIVPNSLFADASEAYDGKIIANSAWWKNNSYFDPDNPDGFDEPDAYLWASDGSSTPSAQNHGVKVTASRQEGSVYFVNGAMYTNQGQGLGNICPYRSTQYNVSILLGLVWTDDWTFLQTGTTHFREYKIFQEWGKNTNQLYIDIQSDRNFFGHLLTLISEKNKLQEYESDVPPTEADPNEPGGISGAGGGQLGTFDDQSDPINVPGLPSLSAVDTGFCTIYNPSLSEIKALSSYMWNADLTTVEFWKKIVADPMDLIIGLNIVPCAVQDGGRQSVKVGFFDSGVVMTKAASQYVELNCGSLTVEPFWDNVMDFSPFTKCKIYLPYIGVQDLNIDEIMGKTIQVVYHIDILSCACTCMIKCGNSVLYTFQGHCGQSIPVTSANYASMVLGMMQIAGSLASLVVTGGASAPAAAAGISSGSGTLLNGVPIEMTDPMQTGIPAGAPGGGMPAKSSGGGNAVHGTMQTVGNVMALKPSFPHSGSLASTGGQLAVQIPYLIFERPRQSLPQGYKSFRGYPSNITATLESLSGYTEVDSIHLDGIPAMAAEIQEIDKLLKSGVIL